MSDQASKDLTERVMLFRETARHVWNTAFAKDAGADASDDFEDACVILFRRLVLREAFGCEKDLAPAWEAHPQPVMCLRVVPTVEHGTPIMINRTPPSGGYWDDPQRRVKPTDVDLGFVNFFNCDVYGRRDFQYIQVAIHGFRGHEALVGRLALIEPAHVRVVSEPG